MSRRLARQGFRRVSLGRFPRLLNAALLIVNPYQCSQPGSALPDQKEGKSLPSLATQLRNLGMHKACGTVAKIAKAL